MAKQPSPPKPGDERRMERLARRAEEPAPTRTAAAEAGACVYDETERRLILYGKDGSVLGRSAPFERDEMAPLTPRFEAIAGGGYFVYAYQNGIKLA